MTASTDSPANTTTAFAKAYEQPRRLGGPVPEPFIGAPKIVTYRARSVTVKRSGNGGADLLWWVEFEAENSTIERAPFKHSDTALYSQLATVLGYDPSNLKFDTYTKFSVRPEVQVSRKGPIWTLHAICIPSRDEMIVLLKEYAEQSGAMVHKGYAIDPIIREHIVQAEKPDFDAAKKAIEGLTTLAEKGLHAGKRIAEQNAAALEATKDPHYASPLTDEMVKSYQGSDPLIDDMQAKGAEVEIEDTPPLPGNGGKSDMTQEEPQCDEHGNVIRKHSTTDPVKMCFAIPNYIKRELSIDDNAAGQHVVALFHGPISADKIRENGTNVTWIQVEQYVARFKTQERDEVAKTKTDEKPQEEIAAPVRPTIAEIDASRVKIRDYGVETLADFKAATGFDNIPAAIEAGKSLKELEDAAWNWDMKRNEDNAQKAAENGQGATEAPTTPAKANEPQEQEKPRSEVVDKVVPPEVPKSMAIVPVQNQLATLPMVAQWDLMRQQADVLIKSGFMPQSLRTPEQVITVMMMGQALKIEPIVAISMINVVSGKPTVSPQLMMALVRKSGQLESFKVTDDGDTCTVNMKRRNEPEHIETFSMKDAASMQLVGKDNWKKQPAVMRKWRAIAAACRVVFPDVCWGIAAYTPEEIDPDIVIEAEAA